METQSKLQPWLVERKELKSGLGDSLKIVGLFVEGDPRRVVAIVNGKNNSAGANAALLAAAPELLNAANQALAALTTVQIEAYPDRNVDVESAIRALIAAIAKTKTWRNL